MAKLIRAPVREARSRIFDSARWKGYEPRSDDIVIGTYSKCGTTWMQRIVSMLVFGSDEPKPIWDLSPWPDMRLFGPIEATLATAQAQTHRRFFKSHLPFDALPVYEGMKFIHVARDGRDAAISLHNHLANFRPETWARLREISFNDPKFAGQNTLIPTDTAQFFHEWVSDPEVDGQGDAACSFFNLENSYWTARGDSNMLLVHYADLKADLEGEMRRVASFLNIEIPEAVWPSLVEAAGFAAMKRQGDKLIPAAQMLWDRGAGRFFNKGSNGGWRGVVASADLAKYDRKVKENFSPALARWIEHGRKGAKHADAGRTPNRSSAP